MRYFFLLLVVFTIAGCNDKYLAEKPKVLIPQNEFEDVLYELTIVQAAKSHGKSDGNDKSISTSTYIQNRFGYDSLTVSQNNTYYSSNYIEYEKMNNRILERLKVLQNK